MRYNKEQKVRWTKDQEKKVLDDGSVVFRMLDVMRHLGIHDVPDMDVGKYFTVYMPKMRGKIFEYFYERHVREQTTEPTV